MSQIWVSQNVLKMIFKSPRFVTFGANMTHYEANWTPLGQGVARRVK